MTELKTVASCVTCHAWNADKSKFAYCPNNNEIRIWGKSGGDWVQEHVLTEHDSVVTGIDWAPQTNRIVTSSQDRNAYVWTFQGGVWKPTLVILRITRAATSVQWSPKENKFAVSCGAKCVAVCHFDKDNDWWVSKHIKKHKSTVLKVAWHPNNIFIATGSSDYKARVFSAFIKGEDEKPGNTPFGSKLPFGELLAEYPVGAWVHSITWSPSGNRLAFVAHDSTITFVDVSGGAPGTVQNVKTAYLPLMDLLFVNDNNVVAAGHSCSPFQFTNSGGNWALTGPVSEGKKEAQKAAGNRAAFDMFKNKVEVGQSTNVQTLDTVHQNCITCLQPYQKAGAEVKQFTSSGLDGRLVVWSL